MSSSDPRTRARERRGPTAPGRPLAALRHRDFRILMAGTMALQIGSWVQTIGLGWLVFHDLNGSATDLALVALLRGATQIGISPFSGFFAGRFERRFQLTLYTTLSAVIASAIAALIVRGDIALWIVYCTSLGTGAIEALAQPLRNLLVFDSVDRTDLTNAIALNSLGSSAMRVIGPALGGVLIGAIGTEGAFAVQAAFLAASAAFSFALRRSPPEHLETESIWKSTAGGVAYVIRDPLMFSIVGMAFLPSVLIYPYVSFLPVFAKDVLKSDESGYAYLAAAVGLGSLAGGWLVAATSDRAKSGQRMAWTCFLYASFVAVFAVMPNLWLALAALTLAGAFHSVYSALNASLMQLTAAPEYRSRVVALQAIMWGTTPFSSLLWGRMIDRWGAPPVTAAWTAAAAAMILLVIVRSRSLRQV